MTLRPNVEKLTLHLVQDDKTEKIVIAKEKPGAKPGFLVFANAASVSLDDRSLGGHFFGFAFLAHHFELAFRGLEFCGDFLLDALCRFFQFR
jgi:hypothetical protein